jgi:hypothetical protein
MTNFMRSDEYFIFQMSLERKKNRLSLGVAVQSLVEICIEDFSAILTVTGSKKNLSPPV